jgi:ATP-binding cassette subfamily C protein
VLVLERGVLVELGSHTELLAADGAYAALHRSWMDASAPGTLSASLDS